VSEQPGRYHRSFPGLAAALVVLIALVVGMVVLQKLTNAVGSPNPTPAVPYAKTVTYVRQQSHLHLLAPPSLPQGWRATSVRYADGHDEHWHLGVLTAGDQYIGLEQGHGPVRAMVKKYVAPRARQQQPVTIDGASWTVWSDAQGDLGLCRRQGNTTTLVVGTADRATLTGYAASLR
jgi:hypothetical protein